MSVSARFYERPQFEAGWAGLADQSINRSVFDLMPAWLVGLFASQLMPLTLSSTCVPRLRVRPAFRTLLCPALARAHAHVPLAALPGAAPRPRPRRMLRALLRPALASVSHDPRAARLLPTCAPKGASPPWPHARASVGERNCFVRASLESKGLVLGDLPLATTSLGGFRASSVSSIMSPEFSSKGVIWVRRFCGLHAERASRF